MERDGCERWYCSAVRCWWSFAATGMDTRLGLLRVWRYYLIYIPRDLASYLLGSFIITGSNTNSLQ